MTRPARFRARQLLRRSLARALPTVETMTLPGADHVPRGTHPAAWVEALQKVMGSNP